MFTVLDFGLLFPIFLPIKSYRFSGGFQPSIEEQLCLYIINCTQIHTYRYLSNYHAIQFLECYFCHFIFLLRSSFCEMDLMLQNRLGSHRSELSFSLFFSMENLLQEYSKRRNLQKLITYIITYYEVRVPSLKSI